MTNPSTQLCTFYVGDLFLGIDVQEVQEVIRAQVMTRVPLASACVRGLINLRGQIVTAVDLRQRLGLGRRSTHEAQMNVVIRTEDGVVSLLVDEIGEVRDVTTEEFENPPATLQGPARLLINGAYKMRDGLLLSLDTREAIHVTANDKSLAPR